MKSKTVVSIKEIIKYKGLLLLLIIQTVALIYVGVQKEGMHIDENYSYILSNSYDTDCISNDAEMWNTWHSGDDFEKFVAVESGQQFAYDKVYYNNSLDAHPPLFYYILHTICSFFPGEYTPWFGLAMNITLILLTQIVLYIFAKEITRDSLWAMVPVAIYGGTLAFFDTALFIRMYALLCLLTILLVRQHYHLVKDSENIKNYIFCFVLTFLGTFTQYYFAFIAFFLAASTCIWLMAKKEWKKLFAYGGAMLLAIVCVFVVYPAGITQITGSETNNVGTEVMSNFWDFSGWIAAIISMTIQILKNIVRGYLHGIIFVGIVFILTVVVLYKLKDKDKMIECGNVYSKQDVICIGIIIGILALTVVLISHISGDYVYVRYVYNLFPVFSLALAVGLWMVSHKLKVNKEILTAGIISIGIIGSISVAQGDLCSYLYIDKMQSDNAIIQECEDKPLVMLNNRDTYHPTGLLHILMNCENVCLIDYTEMEDVDELFSQVDCSNGVVFIVLTDTYWADGFTGENIMQELIVRSEILETCTLYGTCDWSEVYIANQ